MKKVLFLFCILSLSLSATAQKEMQRDSLGINDSDSITHYIASLLENIEMRIINNGIREDRKDRYKLYPTLNKYNFLKLNTQTGRIDQVQWSLDRDEEFSVSVNCENLSWSSGSFFELYPTQNMYQFLLIDKSDGRMWHVQWGFKYKERWIRRIY